MYWIFPPAVIIAYLFGSVPFGLLIARAHGKDLRKIGSGNIGATNVSRALGRKWAYICFLLDVLKGFIPTIGILLIVKPMSAPSHFDRVLMLWLWLAVGCSAILGHIFPIYLKFKGGKGVSTSFGVALGFWPYFSFCAVVSFVVWIAVVYVWRYVYLASMAASIAFLLTLVSAIIVIPDWKFTELWPLVVAAAAIPLMVVIRHRENIGRIKAGTEGKILTKKRKK